MKLRRGFKGLMLAATVLACLLSATAALALPITYTFSGTGYGTWGGADFGSITSGVPFSFTLSGDTINVPGGSGNFTNGNLTGTINIGSSTGTFNNPLRVLVDTSNQSIGFSADTTTIIADYLDLYKAGAGLGTYNLKTSFGPISDPTAKSLSINGVATSIGDLTLTGVALPSLTFSATAVPAPATLLLLGSGLFSLLGYGWRKRRDE